MNPSSLSVNIARVRPDVPFPAYATEGSVAFDFVSAIDVTIAPHSVENVPTGFVIATPKGYTLLIAPRSSLFKKKGLRLANGIGVVDPDFCGPTDELLLQLWNPGDTPVTVTKGERLTQGFFVPVPHVAWQEFTPTGQSRGGIGATGGMHPQEPPLASL